jgi:trans-aconitate methyltransferase
MAKDWNPDLYNNKHAFVYQYGQGILEWLEPQPQERILDLGCGSGQLTSQIKEIAAWVVGMDSSPEMIADAKSKYSYIEFEVGNASDFDYNQPFDAIFSNAALHWVTDYQGAVRCMYRNLKPGGRLVAEFGGKGNVQHIVGALRKVLAKYGYRDQAEKQPWYYPSIGEYATVLEKAGFRVTRAEHFDRPTELADPETGIIDWLSMFAKQFFEGVSEEDAQIIKTEVQELIKPVCFSGGKWYADYKRIRVMAIKEEAEPTEI